MKIFEVKGNVKGTGEYILGVQQTHSHACYLIYGVMKPNETGRELKAGKGHEELFLAVAGNFRARGDHEGEIKEGQAIHLKGDEVCLIDNMTDHEAVYVLAGGHSDSGHH